MRGESFSGSATSRYYSKVVVWRILWWNSHRHQPRITLRRVPQIIRGVTNVRNTPYALARIGFISCWWHLTSGWSQHSLHSARSSGRHRRQRCGGCYVKPRQGWRLPQPSPKAQL